MKRNWSVSKVSDYAKRQFAPADKTGSFLHVHRMTNGIFKYKTVHAAQNKVDELNSGKCCPRCGEKLP